MRARWLLWLAPLAALPACFTSNERGGEALYAQQCANCHGLDGQGLGTLMPPLAGSAVVRAGQTELVCAVRRGLRGPRMVAGKQYDGVMPAFPPDKLADADVANILNYVRSAWGNRSTTVVTPAQVSAAACQ